MTHEIETEPEHTKHEESKNTTNRCRLDKPRINYLMRDVDLSEVHWWVSGSGWDSSISAKSRRCWHTSVLTCRHYDINMATHPPPTPPTFSIEMEHWPIVLKVCG